MKPYSDKDAVAIGSGFHCPGGSVTDMALHKLIGSYKRGVASCYRAVTPEELEEVTPSGPLHISPKIDGEQWCLVMDPEHGCFLANPRGRVLFGGLPVLVEAEKFLSRVQARTVIAGELFAAKKSGRPRHGDLANAVAGKTKADGERIAFAAFDVLVGGQAKTHGMLPEYKERLETLEGLFKGGKRLKAIKTEVVTGAADVQARFDEWVSSGKAEGLVLRADGNRTFKVKPTISIDAVVVGYTERSQDASQVSSFLLALRREDGTYQLVGHCGNLGSEDQRRELRIKFKDSHVPANYREANTRGALYQFVRPEVVVEVRIGDVQAERSDGDLMRRMVLEHTEDGWTSLRAMPGVSMLHPRLVRLRDDKTTAIGDVHVRQVFERVLLSEADDVVSAVELPQSAVLRRQVFTKVTKGITTVRKLLVWKTNKDTEADYPAFVVHWTDYSPSRKDPLKRTVRLAPTEALATEIGDEIIAKEIKKGWNEAT